MLSSEPHQFLLIPRQNSGSAPVICVASAPSAPAILTHGLCLNPAKPVPLPHNSSSTPPDLPRLTQINFLWLSSQVPSVWNTSECPVVSAGNHIHLGKSKAQEEEKGEEMAIDPADILLSADNDNDDDGKLEDYPNNHVGESPSTTE
ncbi:hypothetical protein E4T56_gene18591 [Termitomyces sp. T112]|nr:hypothetical protein E4T56_gene18591 [Termitomyces sp. T112]